MDSPLSSRNRPDRRRRYQSLRQPQVRKPGEPIRAYPNSLKWTERPPPGTPLDPYDLGRRLDELRQQQKREQQVEENRRTDRATHAQAVPPPAFNNSDGPVHSSLSQEREVNRVDSKLATISRNSRAIDGESSQHWLASGDQTSTIVPTGSKLLHRFSRSAANFLPRGADVASHVRATEDRDNTNATEAAPGALHRVHSVQDKATVHDRSQYPTFSKSGMEENGNLSRHRHRHRHTIEGCVKAPEHVWISALNQPPIPASTVAGTCSHHEEVSIPEGQETGWPRQKSDSSQPGDVEIVNSRRPAFKWKVRSRLERLRRGSRDDSAVNGAESSEQPSLRPAKSGFLSRLKL